MVSADYLHKLKEMAETVSFLLCINWYRIVWFFSKGLIFTMSISLFDEGLEDLLISEFDSVVFATMWCVPIGLGNFYSKGGSSIGGVISWVGCDFGSMFVEVHVVIQICMSFALCLIFCVSFLPHICFLIPKAVGWGLVEGMVYLCIIFLPLSI